MSHEEIEYRRYREEKYTAIKFRKIVLMKQLEKLSQYMYQLSGIPSKKLKSFYKEKRRLESKIDELEDAMVRLKWEEYEENN